MRYRFWIFVPVMVLLGTGCERTTVRQKLPTDTEAEAVEEHTMDDGPPLLLGDNPDVPLPGKPIADNSRCYVCHINYMQEDIVVIHARADVGCKSCHGDSDAHIADESWASGANGTPPDTMFPPGKINGFCMGCHTIAKIDTDQHKSLLAGTSDKKYCTDCHGKHRLASRKCKWR